MNLYHTKDNHLYDYEKYIFGLKNFIKTRISRSLLLENVEGDMNLVANKENGHLYNEQDLDSDYCNRLIEKLLFERFNFIFNPEKYINIIFLSRLTFRKGVDLLIEIIPELCNKFENVRFIIGGDGPKKHLLQNMINSSLLSHKVVLLGSLQHIEVRKVMILGHIYLNTSLTEAFCIANVEAASCGLYVVSTDIGGVAEVLPDEMITLINPNKQSIFEGLKNAINKIEKIKSKINGKNLNYEILRNTYNCNIVAKKTVNKIN